MMDGTKLSEFIKIIQSDNLTFYKIDEKNSSFNPPDDFSGNLSVQAETIDNYTFNKVKESN